MRRKIIFFISIVAVIVLFVFAQKNKKKSQTIITSAAPPIVTPVPTEVSNFMDSPEGGKTLILDKKETSYTLFISSKSEGQKIQIYKKERVNSSQLEIPYNTWSPDNAYVFLKQKTPVIDDYLVLQSSGNLFSNGLPYVSIQELFKKSPPDYSIEEVTGWAAPNLLIVNAKLIKGDIKTSFWFDVPGQSFIQLGTYFK